MPEDFDKPEYAALFIGRNVTRTVHIVEVAVRYQFVQPKIDPVLPI